MSPVRIKPDLSYEIQDPQLRAEVEAYAKGPRHESSGSETKETLARLREENAQGARPFQFDRQDELTKLRFGRVLGAREFLNLLNKIVPARYSSQAKNGFIKLEILRPTVNGGQWEFICGAQPGQVPEYSTLYVDSHGVATNEMYRGWRTVLLRLILAEAITEAQAEKVFGRATGPESRRYNQTLYNFRNRG